MAPSDEPGSAECKRGFAGGDKLGENSKAIDLTAEFIAAPPISDLLFGKVPIAQHLTYNLRLICLRDVQPPLTAARNNMANVYVEARPKGRPEGAPISDYVVEDHADHVLGTFSTQREAIDWAKKSGHAPLVARVRQLNDKKKPDHWRSA